MDMKKSVFSYLDPLVMDSRVFEQTQELRLAEGQPDVEKVLGVWGQPVLRSKEWRGDTVGFSGGMLLFVLYRPEDGSQPRMLEGWAAIQGRWDLPQMMPEGKLLLNLFQSSMDARTVSPRKILVRCGLGVCLQALAPAEGTQWLPGDLPEDVHILEKVEPVRLYQSAGEKTFQMEEALSDFGEDQVLCYTVRVTVSDQKVVGNKLAFRGAAELQALLAGEEGAAGSRNISFPFSQFAELEGTFGSNAEAEVIPAVTSAELEEEGDGTRRLKLGITAQYAISDMMELHRVEDAYSNLRPVKLTVEELLLAPIVDSRWETVAGRGRLPDQVPGALQMTAWPEPPRVERQESGTILRAWGTAQVLWKEDNGLAGATSRWDGEKCLPTGEGSRVYVTACAIGQPQPEPASGDSLSVELRCRVLTLDKSGISQVSGMELGEPGTPDPDRPSLILCRAEKKDLWTIAKETGSTVEAIQRANGLEGESTPGQMLLIPIA